MRQFMGVRTKINVGGSSPRKKKNTGVYAIFCSLVPFNQWSVHLHKVQIGRIVGRGYLPLPIKVTTLAYKTRLLHYALIHVKRFKMSRHLEIFLVGKLTEYI